MKLVTYWNYTCCILTQQMPASQQLLTAHKHNVLHNVGSLPYHTLIFNPSKIVNIFGRGEIWLKQRQCMYFSAYILFKDAHHMALQYQGRKLSCAYIPNNLLDFPAIFAASLVTHTRWFATVPPLLANSSILLGSILLQLHSMLRPNLLVTYFSYFQHFMLKSPLPPTVWCFTSIRTSQCWVWNVVSFGETIIPPTFSSNQLIW